MQTQTKITTVSFRSTSNTKSIISTHPFKIRMVKDLNYMITSNTIFNYLIYYNSSLTTLNNKIFPIKNSTEKIHKLLKLILFFLIKLRFYWINTF